MDVLQRKFGLYQQAEVYQSRLKDRMRARREPLPHLAHEMETLVRRAYPSAPEEMVIVLACDHFVDDLGDQQLQIYVKQAHPENVQITLARALEFESFLRTTGNVGEPTFPRRAFQACRTQTNSLFKKRRTSPRAFKGTCWECGETGHKQSQCGQAKMTRSLEELHSPDFPPFCWSCGQSDHKTSACKIPKAVVQAGNAAGLGAGATIQPELPGPFAD